MALTKFAKEFLAKRKRGNRKNRTVPDSDHPYKCGFSAIPILKKSSNLRLVKRRPMPKKKRPFNLDKTCRGRGYDNYAMRNMQEEV